MDPLRDAEGVMSIGHRRAETVQRDTVVRLYAYRRTVVRDPDRISSPTGVTRRRSIRAVADLDLRRDIRAIWMGAPHPPAVAARDLLHHIATSR